MEIFTPANVSFIMAGFLKTIEISILAIIFSVILGTVLALVKQYCVGKLSPFKWLVSAYIELFRCTPNLLWILFIYFTVKGSDIFISVLAFTIFTSAVMAEIIRGGLNSIPKGQFEAAHSQGFGTVQTMVYIVLPQAYKAVVPTLLSQVITTIKDSSYLANVAVIELMSRVRRILATSNMYNGVGTQLTSDVFVLFGVAFVIYFIINFTLSCIVRAMQNRKPRQAARPARAAERT